MLEHKTIALQKSSESHKLKNNTENNIERNYPNKNFRIKLKPKLKKEEAINNK